MAGLRPIELAYFYRRIHARGVDCASLAEAVGRDRATVTRVLNGSRRRGPIWKKLKDLLTPEESALLDVAQSSPWNARRIAKRPRWLRLNPQNENERDI
jgi:hypothetical protein